MHLKDDSMIGKRVAILSEPYNGNYEGTITAIIDDDNYTIRLDQGIWNSATQELITSMDVNKKDLLIYNKNDVYAKYVLFIIKTYPNSWRKRVSNSC